MVEHIEKLCPEFQRHAFPDRCDLLYRHIPVVNARPEEESPVCVLFHPDGALAEIFNIEEIVLRVVPWISFPHRSSAEVWRVYGQHNRSAEARSGQGAVVGFRKRDRQTSGEGGHSADFPPVRQPLGRLVLVDLHPISLPYPEFMPAAHNPTSPPQPRITL